MERMARVMDTETSIMRDVVARYPVVVSRTGQTLARESRYPVATSYKSVTNSRNYYILLIKVIIKRFWIDFRKVLFFPGDPKNQALTLR